MLTIYKKKEDIPQGAQYVELNDLFFNQHTVMCLDGRAKNIIEQIDEAKILSRFKIESKFNGVTLDIDCLSTGCKTVLNVLYFPEIVFCLKECGDNALELLFCLEHGAVYSDYALIPFAMSPVKVISGDVTRTIDDYDELKEWWENEE